MRLFISHSHQDKSIARRVARTLRWYGAEAWLDERELRLGSRLDDAIQLAIAESDAVLVIATEAAVKSVWVEREIAFASSTNHVISICPIYVDDVIAHPLFAPHLGIDARDRYQFTEVLDRLAKAFVGVPLPAPDQGQLEAGVEELSRKSSGVALLVADCLKGEGLRYEHTQLVTEAPFHEVDEALYVISLLNNSYAIAAATAAIFARSGAGSAAVSRYLDSGHKIMNSAVGVALNPEWLPTALRVLSSVIPREDQALASFLWSNAEALGSRYRSEVMHLVTSPNRGPKGFAADAAAAALDLFPADKDLVLMWTSWIRNGSFDGPGNPEADLPETFAFWCDRGLKAGSASWERIFAEFVSHVRKLARTPTRQSVDIALRHMMKAADRENPRIDEIVRECEAAPGTAEWDGWADRDEMGICVLELVEEARTTRKWGTARLRARKIFEEDTHS